MVILEHESRWESDVLIAGECRDRLPLEAGEHTEILLFVPNVSLVHLEPAGETGIRGETVFPCLRQLR